MIGEKHGPEMVRRKLLGGAAMLIASDAIAAVAWGVPSTPWKPGTGASPTPTMGGPWQFFAADEAALVEAIVDRLIPPDHYGAGGKDAGCAIFIDRQLAGAFGNAEGVYLRPPFLHGSETQGYQMPYTPAALYRAGLKAIAVYVDALWRGKHFDDLTSDLQDKILSGLESGAIQLNGADGKALFKMLLTNTQEGFFADPIYGGNRDMVGWTLIGFPGARYDYRDWVMRHNEPYPLPPVGILGRPACLARASRWRASFRARMWRSSGLAGAARSWPMS